MLRELKNIIKLERVGFTCVREYSGKVYKSNYPRRIFSGIQPTGNVHLGNYFGAIQKWVQLQNNGEDVLWSIVDLHSITLQYDPKKLYDNVLEMCATLLACGINPEKSILFQQSTVAMHTQLCWILGCVTTLPRLGHLPQFKEKSKMLKNVPLGLYIYPVLQAADILLYRATHVPVGKDQLQHIQLAQDLAAIFNKKFGDDIFPIPHSLVNENASERIKSLRDPLKKMSKSSTDPKSKIDILDEPDVLLEKMKKAVTDCTSEITYEPEKRAGVANLLVIHSLLTGKTPEQICLEVEGLDTGKYKLMLADLLIQELTPIREEFSRLIKERSYLQEILKNGSIKATEIASDCWNQVRKCVGFENDILFINEKEMENLIRKI
ncbi:tryptophanyl-tRNA synthetase, mitochondrial isoform X1 [Osmia lignaria lignaria]|uniref:tryptophanyl-tRNA synthetase, mitochondrial isoform X1 n=1 Tax=Osmia lignaria lignaria TaxID=1437193 RepID=UPI0014787761|nr:tryptophan--tRNA ligase, mitochondrial isoform X1 [Osmia lignaria]